MKTILLNISFVLIGLTSFTACNNSGSDNNAAEQTTTTVNSNEQTNQELAAVYSCPMHPEVTSNEPGKCSKCGMNLEKATDKDHGHTEDQQH